MQEHPNYNISGFTTATTSETALTTNNNIAPNAFTSEPLHHDTTLPGNFSSAVDHNSKNTTSTPNSTTPVVDSDEKSTNMQPPHPRHNSTPDDNSVISLSPANMIELSSNVAAQRLSLEPFLLVCLSSECSYLLHY
jgi:hypothetical protein